MIAGRQKTGSLVLGLLLALGLTTSAFAAGKSYTGTVSDAMCGAKHMMGNAADCTRACVKKGSKYALVVGDKVYTLEGKTEGLDKYAGEKATVTGDAKGDTITVASVSAPKASK